MLRYVSLVWNVDEQQSADTAREIVGRLRKQHPHWRWVTNSAGLAVSAFIDTPSPSDQVYILTSDQGVILGRLFPRSYEAGGMPPAIELGDSLSGRIVSTAGDMLAQQYWGRYVAFLNDTKLRRKFALRDPSGGMPCYITLVGKVTCYFRAIEDCEGVLPLCHSISRRYVTQRLAYGSLFNRLTGLKEISSLLAGERTVHGNGSVTRVFFWNPLKIALSDPVEDTREAVRLTRDTVRACVHAWATCFESIIHQLSGGLDSSIVLACLKDVPTKPRIVCQTLYGTTAHDDERKFARPAAQRAGCRLLETPVQHEFLFHSPEWAPRTVEPVHWFGFENDFNALAQLGSLLTPAAKFTGDGGDELFFTHGYLPTVSDFLYHRGFSLRALQIAHEDAEVDGVSLWRVLRRGIEYGLLRRPWHVSQFYRRAEMRLLTAAARCEAQADAELIHPLYTHPAKVPPGKIAHAGLISLAGNRRHMPPNPRLPVSFDAVDPLRSQPFLELSLRTPLYVLRHGGRDRSVAREAFAQHLPPEIAARRSKGSGEMPARRGFARALHRTRDLLLGGYLVDNGYLDRDRLEAALSPDAPTADTTPVATLLEYAATEAWCRTWA